MRVNFKIKVGVYDRKFYKKDIFMGIKNSIPKY